MAICIWVKASIFNTSASRMTNYSFISADYYIDFLSNPKSNFWLVTQIDLDKHINS